MSKKTEDAPTAEELTGWRDKYSKEHELPEELTALLPGETEAAIEASAKLAAKILKASKPKEDPGKGDPKGNGKPKDEDKPAGFKPGMLGEMLDKLEKKYGEAAVTAYLSDRLGMDELKSTMVADRMESTRNRLAVEHKLTPEQAAKIPGNTPEELRGNIEWHAEATKDIRDKVPAEPQSSQPGIPSRTTAGGGSRKTLSVEDAEEAFDGAGTALDDLR